MNPVFVKTSTDANAKWKGCLMKNVKKIVLILMLSLAMLPSLQLVALPKIVVPKVVSMEVAKISNFFWNKGIHCFEPVHQCYFYSLQNIWWQVKTFNNFKLFAKEYDKAAGIVKKDVVKHSHTYKI